jgi:hypothetical protein
MWIWQPFFRLYMSMAVLLYKLVECVGLVFSGWGSKARTCSNVAQIMGIRVLFFIAANYPVFPDMYFFLNRAQVLCDNSFHRADERQFKPYEIPENSIISLRHNWNNLYGWMFNIPRTVSRWNGNYSFEKKAWPRIYIDSPCTMMFRY